jgi:hypothetical protein
MPCTKSKILSGGRPSSCIAVHTDGAETETRNAQRLAADLRIPAIEATEVQIRVAIRKASGFDRVVVVHKKQEHIAVAGEKRGGVFGDIDEWLCVTVAQSRTPGTFHMVSPVALPAIFMTTATSS